MGPVVKQKRRFLSPLDKQAVSPKGTEQLDQSSGGGMEAKKNTDSLVEHLSDLRKQFIKSGIVFMLFLMAVFSTINWWFPYVTKENELVVFGPFQVVKFYTSICVTLALGLSLPFLVHFLWQFVKPGLKPKEIRFLGLYSPAMFFLFIGGVAFGYFIVNPLSYHFLMKVGAINFDVIVSAQEYIHFLIMTTIPLGFLFELPIIAMFLSSIGVLTKERMKIARKWAYLVIAIVSALITPPDFVSQLMVLVPMALLYEASIYIVGKMEAKRSREHVESI
ncbi:twin-arginine translocase subunit TatC [Siminovitchia sp. FSL H7-0308]|uniref:Sec-independent protein translocase protein TatC n=1 Tax=Siminovitchia thermophila TaxID=1245522 RepID=A0ABS2R8D1_9BACI|nr:twin-arginine translocase subunit TatC [Siminovitchia thermophila]MBM7715108.1 sec-independent protein translocase protein TatC [Siminovitchia thermophila]ONK22811.1 twin arginine-targeting protein translocase TatC [Bacillus sp. VT-16-64]